MADKLVRSDFAGVEVSNVDTTNVAAVKAAIIPGKTKLVMLESPTNPRMQVLPSVAHGNAAQPTCPKNLSTSHSLSFPCRARCVI